MVLNLSIPEIISVNGSVMTSPRELQCHRDIIMRTPRITGKPRFSSSRCPKTPLTKLPLLRTGDQVSPPDILGPNIITPYTHFKRLGPMSIMRILIIYAQ